LPLDLTAKPLLVSPLLFGSFLYSTFLWAQPLEETEAPTKHTNSTLTLKSGVAQSRNLLGQTAATIGIGLDSIFGSPDKSQPNESTFLLRSGIRHNRNGELSYVNGVTFKADLPSTSSKFQLLIRLDDERQLESRSGDSSGNSTEANTVASNGNTRNSIPSRIPSAASTVITPPTSQSFLQTSQAGIFFRYIYQAPLSPWQTTLDTGWQIETNNFDSEAVSYFRIGRNIQIGEWLLRPVPTVFWTESTDGGAGVALHSQTQLDSITSLQSSSSVNYMWNVDTLYYQHGWQLVKAFNQDLRVTYNITLYANDQVSDPIDEAKVSATLRRRLDGQWLFFSVTPADSLHSDDNFKQDLSITFQLEAKFGSKY